MAVQGREASDQQHANSSFYLAKCILRSSVVLQAVYGHIRSPTTLDIVFGKETSLELVVLSEDGVVQSICEQPVFGKIKDLKVLPWNEHQRSFQPQTHGKDLLVITSDSGKMSFLTFCVESHRFLAVAHVHISQPGNARRELGQFLAVESRGRAIAVSALEDKIAIYPTSIAAGSNIVERSMIYPRESWEKGEHTTLWGTIWSMAFVPGSTDSKLKDVAAVVLVVLLHRKGAIQNEILVLVCDTMERSIQLNRYSPISPPGPLAYSVTDVPDLPGFIFLFRCNDIVLLEVSSIGNLRVVSSVLVPKTSSSSSLEDRRIYGVGDEDGSCNEAVSALLELVSRAEETIDDRYAEKMETAPSKGCKGGDLDELESPLICAWTWSMDASFGSSLMFCMDTGELFLLQLSQSYLNEVRINLSDCLYHSPPLKCLLWMKDGFFAALAEMGDGQVLHFKDGKVFCRSIIENISPILDFSLVDYHNEKQDQMFACAGAGQEGSLRVIRNGVSVEKLVSTGPLYEGVTGSWTMKICRGDDFHAFLVLSFVEGTRVLSVGLSFNDVTDSVGFKCSVCTSACGWIEDGWVAQVCNNEVRVCAPTKAAHPKGLDRSLPLFTCWVPAHKASISLGAVSHKRVILAMSQPGLLLMLGLRLNATGSQELVELQQCIFEAEISCISIPQEEEPFPIPLPPAIVGLLESNSENTLPRGIEVGKICIVGTHKPSVEVLSMMLVEKFSVLAVGHISLINTMGTALSGCVPEDVRLVLFDRPYILSGLRNGMLLRFEWPTSATASTCLPSSVISGKNLLMDSDMVSGSAGGENITWRMPVLTHTKSGGEKTENVVSSPMQLHLIAVRRVGVSPVSLVPLQASLRSDIIALGDRPWLLQTARHSQRIACTSISFQPSTHATPVRSRECMKGILFVADCSLHLVEMEHSKRLNVQRLSLGSTARRIAYHVESKTLLVMRSEWCDLVHGYISDICCIDPVSGALMFQYKFEYTEVPKCMQLCKIGNEHLLLVGTGLTTGKAMMASGEPDGAKGRLLVFLLLPKHGAGNPDSMPVDDLDIDLENFGSLTFAEGEGLKIILRSHVQLSGVVLAVAPYLNQYILACAGNNLSCLGFSPDALHRLKRYDSVKTRFVITCLAVHLNRIAVGDCRDGILLYSYHEYESKFEQLYCDPAQRLVADCALVDPNTALVTDRYGNFCVLTCTKFSEENSSPERNLVPSCWYHMGEVMLRIHKGSLAYKVVMEDSIKTCNKNSTREFQFSDSSVVASTLLGSVVIFVRLSREEYELLDEVQSRLASYPLTAPVLGNNHALYRGRGCPAGVYKVLDGDMLGQFLELTSSQQQSVLADQPGLESSSSLNSSLQVPSRGALPVEKVLRLLELVHSSLT